MLDHGDDLVIRLATGQARGQLTIYRLGLQKQAPASILVPMRRQWDACGDIRRALTNQLVKIAAGLSRVARNFRHPFLVIVQLFERSHRQIQVVFLEAEQTGGVVHQDISVEHEKLGGGVKSGNVRVC